MQFAIYKRLSDIPLSSAAWDQLVEDSGIGGVFLRHAWIHTWWQHLAGNKELFFITIHSKGDIVGFAPLMLDRSRTLRFIADENSDYLGFVIRAGDTAVTGHLMKFLAAQPSWRVLHLRNLPRAESNGQLKAACEAAGLIPWRNYSVVAPYLALSTDRAKAEKLLNKYSVRRAERQLTDQGELRYEVFSETQHTDELWHDFTAQHIKRCRADHRKSPFEEPNYAAFLRAIFDAPDLRDALHFSAVLLNDRAVAYHLGFISNQRLLWYKPSFDTSLTKGSPGIVLIRCLANHALEHNLTELDFTIGAEPFKERFSNGVRYVDTYRIHRSRLRYLRDAGYWRTRAWIKTLIKGKK